MHHAYGCHLCPCYDYLVSLKSHNGYLQNKNINYADCHVTYDEDNCTFMISIVFILPSTVIYACMISFIYLCH